MILVFEAILLHGFLLFTWFFQTFYDLSCYLPATTKVAMNGLDEPIAMPLSVEDCIQDVRQEPVVSYETSILTDEHTSFFNSLSDSINSITPVVEVIEETEEMLTMSNWKKDPEPVAVSTMLAAIANAKINDCKIGEQLWVVEVIGEEKGFIHVSDGSGRLWIDSNRFGSFSRKDILSVLVNRKTDIQVLLLTAEILQEHSTDFSMVDELDCTHSDDYVETVVA